jgi:hypothetical protein
VAAALGLALGPAASHAATTTTTTAESQPPASTGWHGRAIQDPAPALSRAVGASDRLGRALARGTGFHAAAGSDRVREVQRRLRRLGYRPGPVDGRFGPRTEGAVRWFAIKHGFQPSGVAHAALLRHLRERTRPGASADPSRSADAPRLDAAALLPDWAPRAVGAQPAGAPAEASAPGSRGSAPGTRGAVAATPQPRIDRSLVTLLLVAIGTLGAVVLATSAIRTRRQARRAPRLVPPGALR